MMCTESTSERETAKRGCGRLAFGAVLVLLTAAPASAAEPKLAAAQAEELFRAKVGPLLVRKCQNCHAEGEDSEGSFDLSSREGMMKGGRRGPALAPGDASRSRLYQLTLRNTKPAMPPKEVEKLTAEEMADLRAWIDAGAPWPKAGVWKLDPADAWAFRAITRPAVPKLAGLSHPIDAFLQAKLNNKKLPAAPPADPRTLLRRATLDLTGLPPTPEEIAAFGQSAIRNSQSAMDELVERLLASPHYGERQAQHWLDVVRYADTSGFSNDYERPSAWRYRDYVIRSFNEDKRFDRFLTEQLAGDEQDPEDPENLVAVGFLRMGPWEHTGMSVAAVTRQQFLDDITHNAAATFLGLTLRCARCHDHKFDPIPTRDYYRLQAVFAPVQFAERDVPFLDCERTGDFAELKGRIEARIKAKAVRMVSDASEKRAGDSLGKINQKRNDFLQRELLRFSPLAFSVYNGPTVVYSSNKTHNGMPAKRGGNVADIFVLKGGALDAAGEKVGPGLLVALPQGDIPESMQGRRLALARWLTDPRHPLTARVIVNRVWQQHFGKGIVATPNNFGKMGQRPTHPELLDWLAGWFIDNGWSIKKLHRLIMTSAAYARSGQHPEIDKIRTIDGSNHLLAYFPSRRLSAEEIRDSMLAISGELSRTMGGPSIFPEMNQEVALQPRHIMGSVAPAYQPSPSPEERNRRTIYAYRCRTLGDPLLEVFNLPGSEISCECRDQTTVTPQAFALMNGQFVHDRALTLAKRLEATPVGPERVERAFRLVFGRAPSTAEIKHCLEHVATMRVHHEKNPPTPVEYPRVVRRRMIEEFTGDTITWEEDLDVFRNYQRDLKPWDVGAETRAWAELCLVLLNANEFLYVH